MYDVRFMGLSKDLQVGVSTYLYPGHRILIVINKLIGEYY